MASEFIGHPLYFIHLALLEQEAKALVEHGPREVLG